MNLDNPILGFFQAKSERDITDVKIISQLK